MVGEINFWWFLDDKDMASMFILLRVTIHTRAVNSETWNLRTGLHVSSLRFSWEAPAWNLLNTYKLISLREEEHNWDLYECQLTVCFTTHPIMFLYWTTSYVQPTKTICVLHGVDHKQLHFHHKIVHFEYTSTNLSLNLGWP